MKMNSVRPLSLVTATLLAGILCYFCLRSEESLLLSSAQKATLAANQAAQTPNLAYAGSYPHYRWPAGESRDYQLNFNLTSQAYPVADSGFTLNGLPGELQMESQLHTCVLAASDAAILLCVQATETSVIAENLRQPGLETLLNKNPVVWRLSPLGQVLDMATPGVKCAEDRQALITFHSVVAFALSDASKPGPTWTLTEPDATGQVFTSHYRLLGPNMLEKVRSLPSAGATTAIQSISPVVTMSSHKAEISSSYWLESAKGKETIELRQKSTLLATLRSQYQLNALPSAAQGPSKARIPMLTLAAAQQALVELNSGPLPSGTGNSVAEMEQKQALLSRYANTPLAEIWNQLASKADSPNHAEGIAAAESLRDWLLAHPEQAAAVADKLKQETSSLPRQASDAMASRVVMALAQAGQQTPTAQDALAKLITDTSLPADVRLQAGVAAGDVGKLQSSALDAAMRETIAGPDPTSTALIPPADPNTLVSQQTLQDSLLLARGTLGQTDPAVKESLITTLESHVAPQSGNSASDLALHLAVLDNARSAGDPRVQSIATDLAKTHPDPAVRAAAIRLLASGNQDVAMSTTTAALNDQDRLVWDTALTQLTRPELMNQNGIESIATALQRPNLPEGFAGSAETSLRQALTTAQEGSSLSTRLQELVSSIPVKK